ncbi:unnamed protein product, partial [Adineta steineri]
YKTNQLITCQNALASEFFIELKQRSIFLPNKRILPSLFNFYDNELSKHSHLYSAIVPDFIRNNLAEIHEIDNHTSSLK